MELLEGKGKIIMYKIDIMSVQPELSHPIDLLNEHGADDLCRAKSVLQGGKHGVQARLTTWEIVQECLSFWMLDCLEKMSFNLKV